MTLAAPTAPADRLAWLDAVRGLAVFGILVVNAMLFLWPLEAAALRLPPTEAALDRLVQLLVAFAFEGKYFTLFSLLFGIGLGMQLEGDRPVARVVRRLLVMAAIGGLHVTFLWWGDILLFYGVTGLATVAVRRWSPARLLRGAILLASLPLLLAALAAVATPAGAAPGAPPSAAEAPPTAVADVARAAYRRDFDAALAVVRSGSWPEQVAARWSDYGRAALSTVLAGLLALVLAMQWLGLAAWRTGWTTPAARERWRRLLRGALPVALVSNGVYAAIVAGVDPLDLGPAYPARIGAFVIGAASGSLTIAAAAAPAFVRGGAAAMAFAAVGRAALSNYLLQSLVFTVLADGLDGYARIGWAGGLVLTVATFSLQVPLSRWWLARFRFGPVEAAWRAATYGRWPEASSRTGPR